MQGGEVTTPASFIRPTTSQLTPADQWDHFLARWGINRGGHRVAPGLYALGKPDSTAPVFVTANYTLSFDALRSALDGIDGYVMVLDTHGINVWCAAGKGTFGTDELVHRIEMSRLPAIVSHRRLILPQLGAPGVAAHEVKQRTGFRVEYGPVRAADLPAYLKAGQATPEMRRVHFTFADRAVLIPVELAHAFLPTLLGAAVLFFLVGGRAAAGVVAAVLAGVVLFPLLLPWIPTRDFSSKGLLLGILVALLFVGWELLSSSPPVWWERAGRALSALLMLPPITGYLALNFTGATPFTSRTSVRREIFTYVPIMAGLFGAGVLITAALVLMCILGGNP